MEDARTLLGDLGRKILDPSWLQSWCKLCNFFQLLMGFDSKSFRGQQKVHYCSHTILTSKVIFAFCGSLIVIEINDDQFVIFTVVVQHKANQELRVLWRDLTILELRFKYVSLFS